MHTSEPIADQDVHAADLGPSPDMLSLDFEAPGPSNSESDPHLEGSGHEHDTEQLLACISRRWHQGYIRSRPHLEPHEDSDEAGPDRGTDGNGNTSNFPLEDELGSDDSDAIDWDQMDQQCSWTVRDELGEDFESKYAKIGVLYWPIPVP